MMHKQQMKTKQSGQPELKNLLPEFNGDKIPALPLRFEYIPVELLSKQFTKLNNTHSYRVHYLGPRPLHTLALHRRYAYNEQFAAQESDLGEQFHRMYPAPLRRILNSNYMNERLRDNNHYRSSFFYRAFEGMNPTLPQTELSFNSVFENGNLDCAIKISPLEYDLFLRIDSNSRGHTNWYYFSVKNGHVGQSVKLNICNFTHRPGLYDQGLRPYIKSSKGHKLRGQEWQQRGDDVSLEAAPLRYEFLGTKAYNFFRLSFTYTFEFEDDQVFFAYCTPYTYSDLLEDVSRWERSAFVKKQTFQRSLSGLQLPILHISNHEKQGAGCELKKNIVVIGRQHPAQTSGSYTLRGFMNWILEESHEAGQLRDRTNIFVIPMLNPDGVVLGNSRTSAAGKDLNRQFLSIKKDLFPQVYIVKTLIARLQKRYGVLLFLDFHGHSKRKNTFFFGPAYPICHRLYYHSRALPRLVERINPCFRFYSCSFQISESKRSTARAIALNQLKVPYAYTVESSVGLFYSPHLMKTINVTTDSWEEMGKSIALGVSQFIAGLQELEMISKERKMEREKIREGRTKQKEKDKQGEGEKISKRKCFLLDVIEDVKAVVSKGGFEEDAQSDEHDSAEDLEPYQLAQFTSLVVIDREKQRKNQKKIFEEEQHFQISHHEEEDNIQVNLIQQLPKSPPRMTRSVEPKIAWPKIVSKSQREEKRKGIFVETRGLSPRTGKRQQKNFIIENKRVFSTTNLKLLGEDKKQIIVLPHSPLTKRERDSKRKTTSPEISSKKKISTLVEKLCLGKMTSDNLEPFSYKGLSFLQIDNRAMTITTFKRK